MLVPTAPPSAPFDFPRRSVQKMLPRILGTVLLLLLTAAVAVPVLAGYGGGRKRSRNFYDGDAEDPHKCEWQVAQVCPHDGEKVLLTSHARCVLRHADELKMRCVEPYEEMEVCLGDMEKHCRDMTFHQTRRCMEHHARDVSDGCMRSLYFRDVLETVGIDTVQFQRFYSEDYARQAKRREFEQPDVRVEM